AARPPRRQQPAPAGSRPPRLAVDLRCAQRDRVRGRCEPRVLHRGRPGRDPARDGGAPARAHRRVSAPVTAPFFEIGPKNLLRRSEIEAVATAAGRAGEQHGLTVLLTLPLALVAPIHALGTGVRVFAQGMDVEGLGPSMRRVTAEALVAAGRDGARVTD